MNGNTSGKQGQMRPADWNNATSQLLKLSSKVARQAGDKVTPPTPGR